jgi:hypothetical protein
METLTEDEKTQVLEKSAIIKLHMVVKIMKCIELASAKAAYAPNDMSLVGGVYDALLKGLNEAFEEEIKKKASETPAETPAEVPAETPVVEESAPVVEEVPAPEPTPVPQVAFPTGLAGQQ